MYVANYLVENYGKDDRVSAIFKVYFQLHIMLLMCVEMQ